MTSSLLLQHLVQGINIPTLYAQFHEEFRILIDAADYCGLLRLYNRKSLPNQIGNALGMKAGELVELVVRLARTDECSAVVAAIKLYLETFAPLVA